MGDEQIRERGDEYGDYGERGEEQGDEHGDLRVE
jgi:hypothetical protein